WIEAGAEWLHVVNLDGAFAAANENDAIIKAIAALGIPVQMGGGLRSLESVQRVFDLGVKRVVLGTVIVQQPEIIPSVIERWGPEAVSAALDARDGKVTTHGWQESTELTPIELGSRMVEFGVRHALYTDVNRDGESVGVNVAATV